MLLKRRMIPNELQVMRSYHARMELSEDEKRYCIRLEKGYQGELMFDRFTDKLKSDFIIMNGLGLEHSNSYFQLDTTIITQDIVYLFEIKYFEGDFIYEEDGFKVLLSRKEIQNNPLEQLKRSRILLRDLLSYIGIPLRIEGFVVFINPGFTLYQSPVKAPIIFPTQLNRFMNKFDEKPSSLNSRHRKLAEELLMLHQEKSPYEKLPSYRFDQLEKGVLCCNCNHFIISIGERRTSCDVCGYIADNNSLIIKNIRELMLLYPDIRITTSLVFDWLNGEVSKKQICRVLKENYKLIGPGKWSYYE